MKLLESHGNRPVWDIGAAILPESLPDSAGGAQQGAELLDVVQARLGDDPEAEATLGPIGNVVVVIRVRVQVLVTALAGGADEHGDEMVAVTVGQGRGLYALHCSHA